MPRGQRGHADVTRDKRAIGRARALRKILSQAEVELWSRLRGRRDDGLKFRKQHPVAPYIVDFAEPKVKLAIELDGESHFDGAAESYDLRRTKYLRSKGWTVLRFENAYTREDVDAIAGETVSRALELAASCALTRSAPPSAASRHLPPQAVGGLSE